MFDHLVSVVLLLHIFFLIFLSTDLRMSRVSLCCPSTFFVKLFKKFCLLSFFGGVAVGKLNVRISWMRFFVVENTFSFPYCFRSSFWYFLTHQGWLDLDLLAVSEGVEVGIGVIRREKIRCLLLPGLLFVGLLARVCCGEIWFWCSFCLGILFLLMMARAGIYASPVMVV